jgi:tetratricopeptide (TPR) repeat protein
MRGELDDDDRHEAEEEVPGTGASVPADGYAWSFEEQERRLPEEEVRRHLAVLDDYEEEDLDRLDLSRGNDYLLWAATQALEEMEREDEAMALLHRIVASRDRHPALDYPALSLRLAGRLKERGDYPGARVLLEGVEAEAPLRREECERRRAEILVLEGELKQGLWLFEKAVNRVPDDPWIPLDAAWALLQRGEYDATLDWAARAERILRQVDDEEEAREVGTEIDRLKHEAEARRRRRVRGEEGATTGLAGRRERILADVDAEEARLVGRPPRDDSDRRDAASRLADLHARASRAWDDAVESGEEEMVAAFDDLQWEIVGLAERFGLPVPEAARE